MFFIERGKGLCASPMDEKQLCETTMAMDLLGLFQ